MVGAGVAGLAAAAQLTRLAAAAPADAVAVTVFEAEGRAGGKILSQEFSGLSLDLGAESLLVRGDEVPALLVKLALDGEVLRPQTTRASIWRRGRLDPIPQGTVLGVPTRLWHRDVLRILGPWGTARAALEPWMRAPVPDPDGALGPLVADHQGKRVLQRLVAPLLGGIYAGPAQELSLGAVAPQLLAAAQPGSGMGRRLRQGMPPAGAGETPFVTFPGGLARLVEALCGRLERRSVRLGARVTGLERLEQGVRLTVAGGSREDFAGLVLAVPAPEAASLVTGSFPELGQLLRRLEYASVATVTLAYADDAVGKPPQGSGFLVPAGERRVTTACTFLDRKWAHLRRPGRTLLRASVGSYGQEWPLALDDASLVTAVHRELRPALGLGRVPLEARVERWHGSMPQYRVGTLGWRAELLRQMERQLPQVELAGAAYGGIGVAACLEQGRLAAEKVWRRGGGREHGATPGTLDA